MSLVQLHAFSWLLEGIHPPLFLSSHSHWHDLPRHSFFPCCVSQSDPPLPLSVHVIGWLACDAAASLLRSSLDCSDRFFNENRTAVVLQHVWLSIWHFLILYFTQRSCIFSLSESIDQSHCSCFTGISQHISLAFSHPFIHDPSRLISPSFVFPTFFWSHFPKKGGNTEHCVAQRWVHLIRV